MGKSKNRMPIIIPRQSKYQLSWDWVDFEPKNIKERDKQHKNQHKHALKAKHFFKPIK